jgi:DnaJ-domain-containing protein 1
LAPLLRRYALPPELEREPRSEDGSTGPVARSGIVSTYASLQAANGIDLYKALGISSQASPLEIKMAFRKLAKALHPDRNAGDKLAEQHFAAVHEAYTILANAEWRAIYDRELELIRAAAAAQAAQQEAIRIAARRRLILREMLKTAAATVILTACFVTGLSVWQRSSNGLQRTRTVEADAEPPRAHIPATITSAELADALFGSQASQYGNEAATPSSQVSATHNGAAAQRDTVVIGSEPPVPSETVSRSSEPSAPSEQVKASPALSAASDEPPPTTTVAAATAEPALAHAEVTIATAADPPAREAALPPPPSPAPSVPSKTPDQAARAQAERLVGQGDRQFADGNVAIARQYYARAADLGFAPAAIKLADTFDAKVLARLGVHGVRPNPAEAEKWRRRAAELAQ